MTRITVTRIISLSPAHCHNISDTFPSTPQTPWRDTLHEHAGGPPVCPEFMFLNTGTAPIQGGGTHSVRTQVKEEGEVVVMIWEFFWGLKKVCVNDHIESCEQ